MSSSPFCPRTQPSRRAKAPEDVRRGQHRSEPPQDDIATSAGSSNVLNMRGDRSSLCGFCFDAAPVFHKRTVVSLEPDAISVPSGENATDQIARSEDESDVDEGAQALA